MRFMGLMGVKRVQEGYEDHKGIEVAIVITVRSVILSFVCLAVYLCEGVVVYCVFFLNRVARIVWEDY